MTPDETLLQVATEVNHCTKCPLYKGTAHGVPGEGPVNAEIMFIGEGPGFHEDQQGRPFVGAAGKLLEESLAKIGMRREQVYITNVIKHRPPGNRDPQPEEIEACRDYLERQVRAIHPKVIVTLGRFSMARYFPDAKISAIHGQARQIDGRLVVAMFHPAAALRAPSMRDQYERDFLKLPEYLERARRLPPAAQAEAAKVEEAPKQMSLF